MKEFIRLLKVAKSYKWIMALTVFVGFLTIGSSIGLLMSSAWLISKAALHTPIAYLRVAVTGVRFFGTSRGVFRYAERLLSHNTTFKLLAKFRVWFYEAIEPLAPAGLGKFRSGDLLARVVADVESLEHIYIRIIFPPIVAVLISILMYVLFGFYGITFSLIILFSLVVAGIFVPIFTKKLGKNLGKKLVEVRSKLNILTIDLTQGLTELLVFNEREKFEKEYLKTSKQLNNLQFRMLFIDGLNESLITLVMNISILFVLIYGVPQVTLQTITGIDLAVLVVGTMAAFEVVIPIPTMVHHFETSTTAAKRIFEIIDSKSTIIEKEDTKIELQNSSIAFENVNFSYEKENRVLKNISFNLPEKNKIAIVGQSGSGKSTLINLLFRFYNVDSGTINIGANKIEDYDLPFLRSKIAMVSQQTHFFNGTIKENLEIAKDNLTPGELEKVLEKVNLLEKVNSLPKGINTWVGEDGVQLSGGEKQRLAIARMILKDAEILVFDEPTANLDSVNEKKIFDLIFEISKNKSVIFITHRLINLDKFDNILVMKDGKILEHGNYEMLLKNEGYFNKLMSVQNQVIFEV